MHFLGARLSQIEYEAKRYQKREWPRERREAKRYQKREWPQIRREAKRY